MALLTFDEALEAVRGHCRPLSRVSTHPIERAVGQVLAEDICAVDFYPRFDNSSVDGYALACSEAVGAKLAVSALVAAGDAAETRVSRGQAVRIFTGAPIPEGCFGVVMQEDVRTSEPGTILLGDSIREGENVRGKGSEVRPGDVLLHAGTPLDAGGVALLALAGKPKVRVFTGPRVALVTTGDELVESGQTPVGAQIPDTSLPMLGALMTTFGVAEVTTHRCPDDAEQLSRLLRSVGEDSDLIVVSGGVSVGGRDFLPATVAALGEIHFHGVAMRPGKPLLFGSLGGARLFGLPGNPASSFVACQSFVREAVQRLRGAAESPLAWVEAHFGIDHRPCGREDFARVSFSWDNDMLWATPHREQASFGMLSLANCQGVARLSADREVSKGEICAVLLTV